MQLVASKIDAVGGVMVTSVLLAECISTSLLLTLLTSERKCYFEFAI